MLPLRRGRNLRRSKICLCIIALKSRQDFAGQEKILKKLFFVDKIVILFYNTITMERKVKVLVSEYVGFAPEAVEPEANRPGRTELSAKNNHLKIISINKGGRK